MYRGSNRRLRVEPLEDRHLLAQITVNTELDVVDNTDGLTSLREAIISANATPAADTIDFDFGHSNPATILLTQGELQITAPLTVDGLGANLLTIDAQRNSRIFNIASGAGDVTISGCTVTNGRTTGNNSGSDSTYSGGAIRSMTTGLLSLNGVSVKNSETTGTMARGGGIYFYAECEIADSIISGNKTFGTKSYGGGISSRYTSLTMTNSTVSGNVTYGGGAEGGGIGEVAYVTIVRSTISNNRSEGRGGGIRAFYVTLTDNCTISGNIAKGNGGGIHAYGSSISDSIITGNSTSLRGGGVYSGNVTIERSRITDNWATASVGGVFADTSNKTRIIDSEISNNSTAGFVGGFYALGQGYPDQVEVIQSTISGNTSFSSAGGMYVQRCGTKIENSTITNNRAYGGTSSNAVGGVLFQGGTIANTIIAGNSSTLGYPDLRFGFLGVPAVVRFSLIGDNAGNTLAEAQTPDANGNLVGSAAGAGRINPHLGPLADHGGPALTHALLPDSPAIDAGDPSIGFSSTAFDQRGAPYARVVDGDGSGPRIDMGAYESQGVPSFGPGEFNQDGIVDAADYVMWQKLSSVGTYGEWASSFGSTEIPVSPSGEGASESDIGGLSMVNNELPVGTAALDQAIELFESKSSRFSDRDKPIVINAPPRSSAQVLGDLLLAIVGPSTLEDSDTLLVDGSAFVDAGKSASVDQDMNDMCLAISW